MPDLANFQRLQLQLTAHLRNPQDVPSPKGIEERRVAIYRDLLFNNIEGLLSSTFPVLRQTASDTYWNTLIREFLAKHTSRSPLFTEIPREFLSFLESEHLARDPNLPFLTELAHYEWVELALSLADADMQISDLSHSTDLVNGCPVISPLAWGLQYQWPVHRIGPTFQPREPLAEPCYLLAYRDSTDAIEFLELNAVSARLFSILRDGGGEISGQQAFTQIADELLHQNPRNVAAGGADILTEWHRRNIVIGSKVALAKT